MVVSAGAAELPLGGGGGGGDLEGRVAHRVEPVAEEPTGRERRRWRQTVAKPINVTKRMAVKADLAATRLLGRSPLRLVQRIIITARAQRCRFQPSHADKIFWSWNSKINELYEKARPLRCDIWLANDWITLPIAARLAAENGGVYVYDTHEFAIQEYQERWIWRVAQKPIVAALEKKYIKGAKLVSAVSSGIAERITEIYRLPQPAMTIRNTPTYVEMPFRATGDVIRVLYHGIVSPGRGLEGRCGRSAQADGRYTGHTAWKGSSPA